ncbi:regulatory protein GemA [Thermodesulfovibrio yellowstonii]|uniref:regulatory protein GemA n=1 Tax=Thermodesulfovibrio yellowstonii TaxID=28262 RepID=UPI0024B3C607|nr:regulatory protein GemA [Thermodesulfovibrio yellowstonii]
MTAKIHIAKKELGLDDKAYRYILVKATGKDSCKKMTHLELAQVLEVFYRLGFVPKKRAQVGFMTDKEGMIKRITDLAELVMGRDWKRRVRGYIRKKFGVDDLRFLGKQGLTDVFAFLRAIQKNTEPF